MSEGGSTRQCRWWGLTHVDVVRVQAAEFKFTNKNENKNEPENDHFCKSDGRVRFFKNDHFLVHFHLILNSIFEK